MMIRHQFTDQNKRKLFDFELQYWAIEKQK
jgi:hypothetical protein